MATDTGGYQSKFRRDRDRSSGGSAARARRVFEGTEERTTVVTSSVPASGVAGRYRNIGDRGDRTDSVTSRLNNLSTNEDTKHDSDTPEQETPQPEIEKHDAEEEEPTTTATGHKKTQKKERTTASGNSARKRQHRKNLREKRRSTGVVIMPEQPTVAADDDEKEVQENTARNMNATSAIPTSSSSANSEDVQKQLEAYETAIEEWKDELSKAKKEIEALQKDNQRLKDENSALLRVVQGLTGSRKK